VLGEHVEGVDVRLAIRHPAAAERLIDRSGAEPGERVTRTELGRTRRARAALGNDRHSAARRQPARPLIDRSEAHAQSRCEPTSSPMPAMS
jgi:two-component system phosphate regulon sensor histidine kinase PhoR